MDLGTVAQWVGAAATLAAVLVALFKDEVLRLRRRPDLKASIALSPPDCHKIRVVSNEGSADCYYLRLWVANAGKVRAEKVQVFAATLLRRTADHSFRRIDEFLPMNLKWSHGGGIYTDGISPEMGQHCDLGHMIDPQYRKRFGEVLPDTPDTEPILALELEFLPNPGSRLIRPGTYRLHLRIAGSNCKVVTKTLEITITGTWFAQQERMFAEGLGIKMLD